MESNVIKMDFAEFMLHASVNFKTCENIISYVYFEQVKLDSFDQ